MGDQMPYATALIRTAKAAKEEAERQAAQVQRWEGWSATFSSTSKS
jgi:hypothetical protein